MPIFRAAYYMMRQNFQEAIVDGDLTLIRKMKQGDREAFETFVQKYYGEILKYCGWHCQDPEEAKDLTQETFVRFMGGLSGYHHKGKAQNYLYTIAGNLCKDYYKKSRKTLGGDRFDMGAFNGQNPLYTLDDGKENGEKAVPGPESRVTDKILVEWALGQLSEEFREIVILYYFQDLTLVQIARVLGIGLPLAKYRFRQAKIKLKALLEAESAD